MSLDYNTYNMKRVYEGTIYFKITFIKKKSYRGTYKKEKKEKKKVGLKVATYLNKKIKK